MKKVKPQGEIARWIVCFLFVATVLCMGTGSVWAVALPLPAKIDIVPTRTYLNLEGNDAPAISLLDYGIVPGDTILLEAFGSFFMGYEGDKGKNTNMGAVFSSSNILDPSQYWDYESWDEYVNRIRDAIDAGIDMITEAPGYIPWLFDIREDFRVDPWVRIQVPADAHYLFVAAVDAYFYDNYLPEGGSFGVQISKVPEPATMLLLGSGLLGLAGLRRRFRKG